MLGAGDADGAYAAAVRMIGWSVVVGLVFAVVLAPLSHALPRAFTGDPRVLHQAALLWPFLAAMQPLGGAVFALDGILIGAGDTRYLMWSMLAASARLRRARVARARARLGSRRRLGGARRPASPSRLALLAHASSAAAGPWWAGTKLCRMEGLAELHTHLGGSVSSDILWSLAHQQGIALPVKDFWDFDRLVTVSDPRGVPISTRSTRSTTGRS